MPGKRRGVLVDHGQDPQVQQPLQGAPGVEVVGPPGHVIDREQDLAHRDRVVAERLLVCRDQGSLPDARRRLLGRQVFRSLGQAKRPHPRGDGTRGDEHELGVALVSGGQRLDEGGETARVQAPTGRGQRTGPDLDHAAKGPGYGGSGHGIPV